MKSQKPFSVRPPFDPAIIKKPELWGTFNTHDPGIFKDEDYYYVFSTDAMYKEEGEGPPIKGGVVQVRRSNDLVDWRWAGHALNGVPGPALEWTGAKGLWAPDIRKFGDLYRLYYCASQFGKRQSFIGLAESPSVHGPWEDRGEVIKSSPGDGNTVNAIDPNIVLDKEGNPWLAYGSFFGGIRILPIDAATGKPAEKGEGTLIASREHQTREGAVEGPYIVYHPGFDLYYLFVSYDSLFRNYNIRVARSKHITGPYQDCNGHAMTETEGIHPCAVGNKLMGGYRFRNSPGWLAPGHNSVLLDEDGEFYLVHHARTEVNRKGFHLHVRRLFWTDDGWPLASPERYAGERGRPIRSVEIAGVWELLVHDPYADEPADSRILELFANGKLRLEGADEVDADAFDKELDVGWDLDSSGTVLKLELPGYSGLGGNPRGLVRVEGKLSLGWDWENHRPTLLFTGMDASGTAVWGKKGTVQGHGSQTEGEKIQDE